MTTSARESQIYKVKYITSQGVSAIYVFNGGRGGEPEKKKKGSTTTVGFTAEELQEIKQQNVKIISCKSKLYSDDSLATIKIKILQELWRGGDGGSGNEKITFDELYIFGQQKVTINPSLVYQALTQYKKLPLTRERVQKFVANIVGNKLVTDRGPETYTYNDLYALLQGASADSAIIDKTLGFRQILVRGEYPFICNPFNVKVYDEILERFIQSKQPLGSIVWKDGGKLLQDTGPIENNTILLCKAEDVMGHMTNIFGGNDAVVAHNIKYYFPGLYSKNIHSSAELQAKRGELMKLHAKIMTPKLDTYYQNVDMFYGVFEERKSELKYVSRGIKFIKAVMSPGFALKIPLEVLFKVIRAGPQVPLIKYNPASRQENMYRLYTQSVATDGRKIPALKKSIIMRLSKHIGKTKSVAVYMEGRLSDGDADPSADTPADTPTTPLICEFDEAGYMTFTAEFDEVVADIAVIDALFRQNVNPVIEEIRKVLEQSGYNFPLFRSMSAVEVEIKQITYETKISITKSLDIAGLHGCVSSVFVNETNTAGRKAAMPGKNIKLRFKRVSNYSAFNSQEAFIIEKAGQGYRGSDIILALMENFTELSRDQAIEMVSKIAAELEVEKGERQAELKIKENPGFKTTISLDLQTAEITVVTENINSVAYLNTLPIYIDTMIRLTQDKKSTGYPVGKITELCSGAAAVASLATQESQPEQNYANPQFYVAAPPKFNNAEDAADNGEVVVEFGSDDDDLGEDSIGSLSSLEDDMPMKKPAGKGAMNLFFGNLSDSDMSDQSGGAATDSSVSSMSDRDANNRGDDDDEDDDSDAEDAGDIRNIDGLKLNKPYYFQQMIENKDPALIVKEDTKEFNSYSRTCSSDKRRQPVILTDAQLDTIHQEHPGFLREQDVIKYGSDRKHQYNYICPRYWCLKTNTVVNPADLKEVKGPDGKIELQHPTCGKVLPKKENRVKPGYYIYEFYDETEEEGYPGLIPGKHPKGHCLPCCFKKYNTLGRIQAKKTCTANMLGAAEDADAGVGVGVGMAQGVGTKGKKPAAAGILAAKREGEYILNPDKFPLDHGRWGHIPLELQVMFREIGASAAVDCGSTTTTATTERPCLLRHGVEINQRQSFVACISDLLHYGRDEILTISAMRQKILKAITIDSFLKYQNGNLVEMFYSFSPDRPEVSIHKYQHSRLYASVYGSGASTSARYTGEYFKKVVSAFENFSAYMSDNESFIDHTYLWDIVSTPNKQLFPYGLNLIIFKLPHDDITNNVQLLCPTNHYSTELFSVGKPSVFLILDDGYYEPLYSYDHKPTGELSIIKEFGKANTPESIETIFKRLVRPFYEQVCRPMDSMPGVYRAKRGLLVDELIRELEAIGGEVGKHVMNFNSKIIGVMASLPGMGARAQCFVPCYPSVSSSLPDREDYVFMTDENLWQTYENTVHFLQKLSKLSKQKIPCAPTHKIIEDELIVGILTETGQFVQISHPISAAAAATSSASDLREIRDTSYITHDSAATSTGHSSSSRSRGPGVQVDAIIATEQGIDNDRYEYIKKIKMETQFYNVFRNTVRILLNDYKNIKLREQLKNETGSAWALYSESLKRITALLRELVGDTIQFTGDDNYYKLIDDISTCVSHNGSVAGADAGTKAGETNTVCTITSGGKQTLLLPRNNLITGKPNEVAYFGKMADELLRYTQIKQFMFQPQVFLSFGNIGYNLKNTEMMLSQSSLTQEFFETLVPAAVNKYSHFNAADSVVPILGQYYDNAVDIHGRDHGHGRGEHAGVAVPELECPVKTYTTIRGLPADWNKCFPAGFKEIEFGAPNELLPAGKPGFGTLPACTFDVMINLLDTYVRGKEKFTIGILKNVLYTEYTRLGGDSAADTSRRSAIYLMLEAEGKRELLSVAAGVGREPVSFEFVYGEMYYLTLLDMVIIAAKYQVPVVFVCAGAGAGAGAGEQIIKVGGAGAQGVQSAIVFVSSSVTGATKTVVTANGELFFPIYSSISSEYRDRIATGIEITGVDHVLELLRPAASAVAAVAKKPRAKRVIKAAAVVAAPAENVLQDDEVMPALITPPGAAATAKKTVRRTKKAAVAMADIKDVAAAAVPLVAKTVRKRVAKAKVV